MDNTRRVKRRHLFFYLQVIDVKVNKLLGYVVDITPHGLKVVSEEVCKTGLVYDFKMNLQDNIGQKKEIQFKAKCAWAGLDANSDFYANGFEIKKLNDNDVNTIETIISEYGFEDLD